MNVTRILQDTPATVSLTTYRDGTATDVGTVTLTATKADGTALFTDQAVTDGGSGAYSYAFTATQTAELNLLKLVWTESAGESYTTAVEIVGAHVFTEAEARAIDNAKLSSTSDYTDAAIMAARDRITDLLETNTGVSWVPRFAYRKLKGNGTCELQLPHIRPHRLISVTIDGVTKDVDDFDLDEATGVLTFKTGYFTMPTQTTPRNVIVEYAHGYEYLRDGVDNVALKWLVNTIIPTNFRDRVISRTDELGTIRLAAFFPSGIPEVDGWVRDHDHRMPIG